MKARIRVLIFIVIIVIALFVMATDVSAGCVSFGDKCHPWQ